MRAMKITAVLCFFGILFVSVAGKVDRRLLNAIKKVESGGDENAVGDGGKSRGAYQISRGYYKDAVDFDPSLRNGGKMYKDVFGKGSTAYAERVVCSYMARYATPKRLGRKPRFQDIARIHNGGPNGHKKPETLKFWRKVQQYLRMGCCGSGYKSNR